MTDRSTGPARVPTLAAGIATASDADAGDILKQAGIEPRADPQPRTPRATPQRKRGIASRELLLTAARAVLEKGTLSDLTATHIAARAGISRAAFYLYFEDLQHLLLELAEAASKPFQALADNLRSAADANMPDQEWSAMLVDGYIDAWGQDAGILLFRNLESDRGDQRFTTLRIQTLLPLVQVLVVRLLKAKPALPPEEALIEAGMIIAMCGQIAIQKSSPGTRITEMPNAALCNVISRMIASDP